MGSIPIRRTTRLAVLFRCPMNGRNSALKPRCTVATDRATRSGLEIAQFLGISSPTTISTTVDSSVPSTSATPSAAVPSPAARSGPVSSSAIDGSASMPMTSPVTVIPSCAPDSWNVRLRTASSALEAPRSPFSTACSRAARSTVVSENSAATKTPQASASATDRTSSSTSVIGTPPAHARPDRSLPRGAGADRVTGAAPVCGAYGSSRRSSRITAAIASMEGSSTVT